MKKYIYILFALLLACTQPLSKVPTDYESFMRVRGDLSGKVTVFYWKGWAYSQIPNQRNKALFAIEGFNIGRLQATDSGHVLLTKELMVYKDPATDSILTMWENPFTGDSVQVIPVLNNPVNQVFVKKGFRIAKESLGAGRACFYADIHLLYPSPLPASEYPQYSGSSLYQASELFQFFYDESDMKRRRASVYADIAWTRIGPWLPWMAMGAKEGQLLYQTRGYKLPNGFASLPPRLRAYLRSNYPEYAAPPEGYTKPNETSWTYFKKWLQRKQ